MGTSIFAHVVQKRGVEDLLALLLGFAGLLRNPQRIFRHAMRMAVRVLVLRVDGARQRLGGLFKQELLFFSPALGFVVLIRLGFKIENDVAPVRLDLADVQVLDIGRVGTDALEQIGGLDIRRVRAGFGPPVDPVAVDLPGGRLSGLGDDFLPVFPGRPAEQGGAYDDARGKRDDKQQNQQRDHPEVPGLGIALLLPWIVVISPCHR